MGTQARGFTLGKRGCSGHNLRTHCTVLSVLWLRGQGFRGECCSDLSEGDSSVWETQDPIARNPKLRVTRGFVGFLADALDPMSR